LRDYSSQFFTSQPNKIALTSPSVSLSYREIGPTVQRIAANLSDLDIGNTFFYLGQPGVLAHVYFLACLRAGKSFLSINKKLTSQNILAIVSELGRPACIFTDAQTDTSPYVGLTFERLPLLPKTSQAQEEKPENLELPDDRIVLYNTTSGSTGVPKIIPITFADLVENIRLTELALDIGQGDVVGNPGEFCAEHLIVTLKAGATMSFSSVADQSAQATREWLERHSVSLLICYVSIFRAFRYIEGYFPHLRAIRTYADAPLPSDIALFNRMCGSGAQYHSFLALQEIAYVTRRTWAHGEAAGEIQFPIGNPVLGGSVFLADERGDPVLQGQTGEIVIRTPLLSNFINGYVGGRTGSGRLIRRDGVILGFAIGDLATQDASGALYFAGRIDDQVKLSGFNVRLLEVEQAIRDVESIVDVAVTVQGTERENRVLCCHYVGVIEPTMLRKRLRAHLPDFMVPHHCLKLDDLPRTATGKVDKLSLLLPLDQSVVPIAAAPEATTDLANHIRDLWTEILGHSNFEPDSNFLDMGGDSLALIKMSLAVENRYGVRISFERFKQAGMSVNGLMHLIANERAGNTAPAEADPAANRLNPQELPETESMLLLNRMILEKWNAKPVGRANYFVCEHPDAGKMPLVWIFQTEAEYQSLTKALEQSHSVYGGRSMSSFPRFFENGPQDDMSYYTPEHVSELAARYVSEAVTLIGSKPFVLGGNCQAGILSLAMAEAFAQRNIAIERLILLNAVEDRQDYALPTTLLFGKEEFEEFSKQPKGLSAFANARLCQIGGRHGQYFHPDNIGTIVDEIRRG